ncbi:MAG: SIS domain-containing protein [Clostridiaceae bacterium]
MHHEESESKNNIDLNLICDNFHKVIEDYKKKDLSSICEKIYNAEGIFVFGTGNAQKSEANELKRIFLTIGKCFYDLFDVGEVELLEDTLTDKDLMFIISLSGETESALKIAKKMRVMGMPVISLTRLKDNSLAKLCGENLYVGTAFAKGIDNLNYETTTLYFIFIEILFLKYQLYLSQV